MKRTTIFLPDDLHERLRREAFESRVSMAELVRRRLARGDRRRGSGNPLRDPLKKVIGIISHGDLTSRIDEDLYGE